ncbi:hypothetical protein YB2330_001727 [Saitoella coloradoensis]
MAPFKFGLDDPDDSAMTIDVDLDDSPDATLPGAPIKAGSLRTWQQRRTLKAIVHPLLAEGVAWIDTNGKETKNGRITAQETRVYGTGLPGVGMNRDIAKYIPQFAHIFADIQKEFTQDFAHLPSFSAPNTPAHASRASIPRFSRLYRDTLFAMGKRLTQGSPASELALDCRSIWLLFEAVYFPENGGVAESLMNWLNSYDPKPATEDGQDIMTYRPPAAHPEFWNYIYTATTRGLFSQAAECLNYGGLAQQDPNGQKAADAVSELLRDAPRRTGKGAQDQRGFDGKWRAWRGRVINTTTAIQKQVTNQNVSAAFRQLMELLKGDKDAIFSVAETLPEAVCALALLYDPVKTVTPDQVKRLWEMANVEGFSIDSTLDSEVIFDKVCQGDVYGALVKCHVIGAELGLSAHLGDLMDKADLLEKFEEEVMQGADVRQWFLLEFGERVMAGSEDNWEHAVAYWRAAGDTGMERMAQALPRVPLTSEKKATRVVEVCTELGLDAEAVEVSTNWARILESQGKVGEALKVFDKVENVAHIDRIAWMLFERALLQGKRPSRAQDPILEDILSEPGKNSHQLATLIAPYATLHAYYQYLREGRDGRIGAAAHLASILRAPETPRQYVPLLIAELLSLLDTNLPRCFALKDLFEVTAVVEEYFDVSTQNETREDGLRLLQEALDKARVAKEWESGDWRGGVGGGMRKAGDIVALVRMQIVRTVGRGWVDGEEGM